VSETIMAQTTIAYLERRYSALESEIANALRRSPTDDSAIADLKYRKLIVADEIQHNRRLVQRFGRYASSAR
jgi:hypothetical protein